MPISQTCSCGRTLSIPDSLAGRTVNCPACGAAVAVPAGDTTARALPRIVPPRGGAASADGTTEEAGPRIIFQPEIAVPSEGLTGQPVPVTDADLDLVIEAPPDENELRTDTGLEARKPSRGPKGRSAPSRRRVRGRAAPDLPPDDPSPPPARPLSSRPAPAHVPLPATGGGGARCPMCNTQLKPHAIVCHHCGAGPRSGGMFMRGDEPSRFFDYVRSFAGPALAIAIVAGLVIAWKYGMFSKAPPEKAPPRKAPVAAAPAPAQEGPGTAPPVESPRFGGTVSGSVDLADTSAPYEITETVRVPAGATLRIGPGVILKGARLVDLRTTGGDLVMEGSARSPVVVSMPLVVSGMSGGLTAKHCVFEAEVFVKGSAACRVEQASFTRGLKLEAKEAPRATEWAFVRCEFHPLDGKADACLEVDIGAPAARHKVSVRESNIRSGVKGKIGWSSRLDLGGNHWSVSTEKAVNDLKADGSLLTEPVLSEAVPGAGASHVAVTVGSAAPGVKRNSLVNKEHGFEIAVPEGWRAAGSSMLLAPKSYRHSTKIQIMRCGGVKTPSDVPRVLGLEIRRSSAKNVKSWPAVKLDAPGVEGLSFLCTFDAGNEAWARKSAIIDTPKGIFAITLSARGADLDALDGALDAAVRSFRTIKSR